MKMSFEIRKKKKNFREESSVKCLLVCIIWRDLLPTQVVYRQRDISYMVLLDMYLLLFLTVILLHYKCTKERKRNNTPLTMLKYLR